jgi:hypothetical protein
LGLKVLASIFDREVRSKVQGYWDNMKLANYSRFITKL